jgi:hypothetical protein
VLGWWITMIDDKFRLNKSEMVPRDSLFTDDAYVI